MKRIAALAVSLVMIAVILCACSKDMGRLNYNYDMKKYVKLDSYSIEVDSSSEEYKEYYADKISELLIGKVTEGKVQDGDTANIDYVGKKDGEAFSGGTAKGSDLVIGSGTFIDGFEEGLIGVEIGSTVDLNLTFPKDYHNTSLAGKAVVFTVTVNHVMRECDELTDDTAKFCGYESAAEIEKEAKDYAVECVAWSTVYSNAKVEKHPEKETEVFIDMGVFQLNMQMYQQYGMTLEQYLTASNNTMEGLRENLKSSSEVKSMEHNYALSYFIIDQAGIAVTDQMVSEKIKEVGGNTNLSRNFYEAMVVNDMAMKVVAENATLK